ncbi:MAG: DUF547 domain-containing protein [Planctomycetota bacterium]|nr:DUF547 domain-containing protein [Planctomycetota bacterium]MDA1138434.1 DUF547 domain-containing protein [Planctomycetota bacterium]
MKYRALLLSICVPALASMTVSCNAADFDHSHALLDKVLKKHLKDGLVNYKALKGDRSELDNYLKQTSAVREAEFKSWSKDQQLAFYINLYNSETFQLIVDNYPVVSIKKIGGIFSGPWDEVVVDLFGKKTTLNKLEHSIIRKQFSDARVHFALVCAAKGCPPLRDEPFVAEKLDDQLKDQGNVFLSERTKNRVDTKTKTVHLSKIFSWYAEDFVKSSGSVLLFVRPFFPDADREALLQPGYSISYTDYDWSLNEK